jgi:hypothetical protein
MLKTPDQTQALKMLYTEYWQDIGTPMMLLMASCRPHETTSEGTNCLCEKKRKGILFVHP